MRFVPLFDRIVVRPLDLKVESKIIIPDVVKGDSCVGEVVALGKDVKNLKLNSKVVFDRHNSVEFRFGSQCVLILKEVDVLALIIYE